MCKACLSRQNPSLFVVYRCRLHLPLGSICLKCLCVIMRRFQLIIHDPPAMQPLSLETEKRTISVADLKGSNCYQISKHTPITCGNCAITLLAVWGWSTFLTARLKSSVSTFMFVLQQLRLPIKPPVLLKEKCRYCDCSLCFTFSRSGRTSACHQADGQIE